MDYWPKCVGCSIWPQGFNTLSSHGKAGERRFGSESPQNRFQLPNPETDCANRSIPSRYVENAILKSAKTIPSFRSSGPKKHGNVLKMYRRFEELSVKQ